jgi:hypothetical protein
MLVGTWAAAEWAIRFYERHGFALVSPTRKTVLLTTYWNIPQRQIETSVVPAIHPTISHVEISGRQPDKPALPPIKSVSRK